MSFSRNSIILIVVCLCFGCAPLWGTYTTHNPASNPLETENPTLFVTSLPKATNTPRLFTIWISPAIPENLAKMGREMGFTSIGTSKDADFILDIASTLDGNTSTWIYVLVAPFSTLLDKVSIFDLNTAWQGEGEGLLAGAPLFMNESTKEALTYIFGVPDEKSITIIEADELLKSFSGSGSGFAIVPFEELDPRWKVITIDGQSPIQKDFDPSQYPLQVSFSLNPSIFGLPKSNRDPSKLTTLIMTGVTALVRATAVRMVTKGLTYPGEEVRGVFRAADLLHISNEIPFYSNCPPPIPLMATLTFCSDPSFITLLEDIGTDIVELTGNHFQDYGSEATLFTVDMYRDRGWVYYGGGENQTMAQAAQLITHNGNKLAFIGCNIPGPEFAWAGDDRPGAAQCDFDFMYSEITRLRNEGYLPIVTFQHYEYYSLYPSPAQVGDFHNMTNAGAVIVSGSQSHFPQYMEFDQGAYIHYGLGNLFFDQMDYPAVGTRREFADRHVFYDGKYIATELLTFMLEDYARPREMDAQERDQFLLDIFHAAGWVK